MNRVLRAAFVVGILALAGCSDDSPLSDPPSADGTVEAAAPTGEVVEVQSIDNTFRPETVEIAAGTEVRWSNVGRNEHNIIPVGSDDWGVATEDFAPGDEYSHVFGVPGTYAYYCSIHGTETVGMIGTVVVSG